MISLLKLSRKWKIPTGVEFSIAALDCPELAVPPALKIRLAIDYHVPNWFIPAFVLLLSQAEENLEESDSDLLGTIVLHRYHRIREGMRQKRNLLFRETPPAVISPLCRQDTCADRWVNAWRYRVMILLTTNTALITSFMIRDAIVNSGFGVCEDCVSSSITRYKDVFDAESVYLVLGSASVASFLFPSAPSPTSEVANN